MIHLDDLYKIVELTLCSAYVKGDKPLSILIISDRPESGKTEAVKRYSNTPYVDFSMDISGHGLKRDFCDKIMRGEIYHIVIPELLQPLLKGQVTARSFVTTLQTIMEDGVMGLHTGYVPATYLQKGAEIKSVGIIGCMPRPLFTKQLRYEWAKTGFLSRWMIVTYSYDNDAVEKIVASIEKGDYLGKDKKDMEFDGNQIPIVLPLPVAKACTSLAMSIVAEAKKVGLAYGFREIKHIRSLVAANVIHERVEKHTDRTTATMADFEEVERLGYLFNEQYNAVKS